MVSYVWRLLVVGVFTLFFSLSTAVVAIKVRPVEFTASSNYTGSLVLLVVPEDFLDSFTGLYVSNASDCGAKLPTWWENIGGLIFIVFDSSLPGFTAGQHYGFYLCYGDVVVPKAQLYSCSLPGTCNASVAGGRLGQNGLAVDTNPRALQLHNSTTWGNASTSHSIGIDAGETLYWHNASIAFNTTIEQDYTVTFRAGAETVATRASLAANYTTTANVSTSYDTGRKYYDTGVYTVYDFGRRVHITNGSLVINVYDSDYDTYYIYIYIDGQQVYSRYISYYGGTYRLAYDLSGRDAETIAVRVYDTERNDYVRAYGTITATYTQPLYEYHASARLDSAAQALSVTVSASQEWAGNATATAVAYEPTSYKATVTIHNATLLVIRDLRLGQAPGLLAQEALANTSPRSNITATPASIILRSGDEEKTMSYDSYNEIAVAPGWAAASLTRQGVVAGTGDWALQLHPGREAVLEYRLVAGLPGTYSLNWSQLLAFNAYANYTGLYIGSESQAQGSSSTGGGGGNGGNQTIVVNVEPSPYTGKLYNIARVVSIMGLLGASVYFFINAVRTNRIRYIIYSYIAGAASSILAFALGDYTLAKILMAAAMGLTLYAIIERLIDILAAVITGRTRHMKW